MSRQQIKVAILDEHPLAVCGLRLALAEAGFDVVDAVTDASGLFDVLDEHECDVVVADYSMTRGASMDGWCFLSSLAMKHAGLPVLVYSRFDDPFLIGSLAQRGVAGIVSKSENLSQVFDAVRALARGRRFRSPMVEAALHRFHAEPELQRFGALTARQMEIAGFMLCGMSVMETSRLLGRGKSTISKRRIMAYQQLGFSRESDLYLFASHRKLWLNGMQAALDMRRA
ncbi:hypothetical protein A9R05_32830 (plasmid) [Burkholderia sp. KK1]|nr:hypothetical protein A9R05_32830 [Burkholderia sp. KK1]